MRRLLATLLALTLSTAASAEDVIVLDNGREARGRIVEDTDAGISLDIGGGKMFYARSRIKEVRRDAALAAPSQPPAPAPFGDPAAAPAVREEAGLLYQDGRRVGARTLRVSKLPDGFRFEEEVVLLDAKGAPEMQVRTTERCDADYEPVSFLVRESAGEKEHRMLQGEVRGGRLYASVVKAGEKTPRDDALPQGARFPFAAREMFLRESRALAGRLECAVYDAREQRWRGVTYTEGGSKPLDENGRTLTVRVVVRHRGDTTEREWVDDKLVARMSELGGESLRAIGCGPEVAARVRRGDTDRITGPDSAARTTYADAEGGWRIGKPDPSWTFEEPVVKGGAALVSVKNAPLFASVDLVRDNAAPPGVTIERAAESLQRLCRTIAPDFRVIADGYVGTGPERVYWLEASATTKGERTRTLARVLVRNGRVFRLLGACPESVYAGAKPDIEKVLASFEVL